MRGLAALQRGDGLLQFAAGLFDYFGRCRWSAFSLWSTEFFDRLDFLINLAIGAAERDPSAIIGLSRNHPCYKADWREGLKQRSRTFRR